ncbi:hypothetical protein Lesp02_28570 [Lentzea sp. NBRC 105346]|nr:hypothetical protein Lesp02_28570 [Lentzea sp. NBRC 105346]
MSDLVDGRSARIAWRRRYTGESARAVRDQLKGESGPVMPTPSDSDQTALEAAILRVLSRVVARPQRFQQPFDQTWPLDRVRPATGMVSLELQDQVLQGFLFEALPVHTPGGVRGIPGVRVIPARSHLDLRWTGPGGATSATVRLLGVSKERWRAIEPELILFSEATPLWAMGRNELHDAESTSLRTRPKDPISLMSAVLRRLWLWHEATWFATAVDESMLRVYWRHGPTHAQIVEMLQDPLCGVPGVAVASRLLSNDLRGVALALLDGSNTQHTELHDALAWANPDSMPRLPNDIVVPFEVWDQEEMRDALSRREISSVYRLLRRNGVTQRQIAALTGQSQSEVSEILKGRQVRSYDVLTRIAAGLGVPRGYMGLAYDETTASAVATLVDDSESAKRRRFLAHAARSWAMPLSEPPEPKHVAMADVRQVEAATRALRALAWQHGEGTIREALRAQLEWARTLLIPPAPDLVRERLMVAIANLEALAG